MKNREKVMNMNIYDLLVLLNEKSDDESCCVLDAIEGREVRCPDVKGVTCEMCIAKWLNEEVKQ